MCHKFRTVVRSITDVSSLSFFNFLLKLRQEPRKAVPQLVGYHSTDKSICMSFMAAAKLFSHLSKSQFICVQEGCAISEYLHKKVDFLSDVPITSLIVSDPSV